jgi:hypothetical protein
MIPLLLSSVLLATAAPAPVAEPFPRVQVWAEDRQDLYRSGEPMEVFFETSDDAYVAVLWIDTSGEVDLLFPDDPRDPGHVRGRRAYEVFPRSRRGGWTAGDVPGIGYLFAIASYEPLDLRALVQDYAYGSRLRDRRWSIVGDPFYEMDRVTELLVGDTYYTPFSTDVYSYHVGGRHAFPGYACYEPRVRPVPGYHGDAYRDCDWLRESLRVRPEYYDTRRYRGERDLFGKPRPRREQLRRRP